jgi:hypothetical protein
LPVLVKVSLWELACLGRAFIAVIQTDRTDPFAGKPAPTKAMLRQGSRRPAILHCRFTGASGNPLPLFWLAAPANPATAPDLWRLGNWHADCYISDK